MNFGRYRIFVPSFCISNFLVSEQELTSVPPPGFGLVTVSDNFGPGPDLSYSWNTCGDEHHWSGTAATNPCSS